MVRRLAGKSSKLVTTMDSTTMIEYIGAYDDAKIDYLDKELNPSVICSSNHC